MDKSIMQLADEIISQHGIPTNIGENTTQVMESRTDTFSQMPVAEDLPAISDGQRNLFLEGVMKGIKTKSDEGAELSRAETQALRSDKEARAAESLAAQKPKKKRKPTNEEIQILHQAAKILRETTFAGSIGVNMGGASTYDAGVGKKKKKKKGMYAQKKSLHSLHHLVGESHVVQGAPASEFGRTFDNAWQPYKNSIAGKPQSLDRLAKAVLRKIKK